MTSEQIGAIAVLMLIVFCVGIWCGTGLGRYVVKNRVYLWQENGVNTYVEADEAERVDLIINESWGDDIIGDRKDTIHTWRPHKLSHEGRALREGAKRGNRN